MTFREKLDAFLFGMAKAFDLFNVLRPPRRSSRTNDILNHKFVKSKPMTVEEAFEADRKALRSDWKAVGDDMRARFRY